MGANESKEIQENEDTKVLRLLTETKDLTALSEYVLTNSNKWQSEQVKFGITGRSSTGKSTFINAIRNVHKGHPTFAKSGFGNTTQKPEAYEHPVNNNIVYYDLPGFGTLQFPKTRYIKDMKIVDYHHFFIFIDTVIGEEEVWIIKMLKELKKPFCLIRSKLDQDITNAKTEDDKRNDGEIIFEIRNTLEQSLKIYNQLHSENAITSENIFLISSREKTLGDMDRLVDCVDKSLPSIKFEVLMYSIRCFSKAVLQKKYEILKKRIIRTSFGTALIAASPLPAIDLTVNTAILVQEVQHCVKVFNLTSEEMEKIPENIREKLKFAYLSLNSVIAFSSFVVTQLGKLAVLLSVQSVADVIFPIIGSTISSATTLAVVYQFLSSFLKDLKTDAEIVLDFLIEQKIN